MRDLVHVDDIFSLIDRQLSMMHKVNGKVYNIGGGREVSLSLRETTALCEKITGNTISIGEVAGNRPGDISIYLTDSSRALQELGWKPRMSAVKILEDTYRWVRENEQQVRQALL